MSALRMTDAQKRAAVERLGDNLAVRSGAGSGKTFVLARRFTELLLNRPDDEDPLSHFVALTFTDKAAIEMSQRVRRMLMERLSASRGDDRRKLARWVQELPDAQISTIHSFCASLLRAHAVLVGVDPNFSVCPDDVLMGRLRSQAADETLLRAVEEGDSDAMDLLGRTSYDGLVRLVETLVANRTNESLTAYTSEEVIFRRRQERWRLDRSRAIEKLRSDEHLRRETDELKRTVCADPSDKLLAIRDGFVEAVGTLLNAPDDELPAAMENALSFKPGRVGGKKAWDGEDTAVRHRIKDIAAGLAETAFHFQQPGDAEVESARTLAGLARLAIRANDAYSAVKRRAGMLDFTDLLVYAKQLLASRPEIARELRRRIDQLLIDEAQDTDAFQLDMLLDLIFVGGDFAVDEGRLFVVGDAKQSIYRFRGAQVEVFEKLCADMTATRQESLDVSFRTHEAGIAFVNELFSRPELLGDDYEPLRARRRESPAGPSVEILLGAGEGGPVESAEEADELQAAATAERVARMVESRERTVWDAASGSWRAAEYGDIAILFSRMTQSARYERRLAERGVPYYVIGGTDFFNRQEIHDLVTALRAIDNPFDDIAVFGFLRSDMIALDDEALMRLSRTCERPYLPAIRKMIASGDWPTGLADADRRALAQAVNLLTALRRCKDALRIDELIRRVLDDTAFEAVLLSQPGGKQMAANVRRLTDLAAAAFDEQVALADFLTQMEEVRMDESRFEQADVTEEADNVVRLMTIHKAKGLEFPVVFLPDLNTPRKGTRKPLLFRTDWGWTCKTLAPKGRSVNADEENIFYRAAKKAEDDDQRREDIRKLYVAATRHMDRLIFVGADQRKTLKGGAGEDPDNFKNADSYLSLLNEALGILPMPTDERRIAYAGGKYELIVRRVQPSAGRRKRRGDEAGRRILREASCAGDVARNIAAARRSGAGAPALMGPLPTSIGRVEIGVTALGDFAHCPMLYRWRHELRVVTEPPGRVNADEDSPKRPTGTGTTDALTLGSVLHKCLELLDFRHPQPADSLVEAAIGQLGFEQVPAGAEIVELWRSLQTKFMQSSLFKDITSADKIYRELDFVMDAGCTTLRGQVDLACVFDTGRLKIVDYKSDQVSPARIADRAGRYELQLLIYAGAMTRYFGAESVEAEVYFLRPAASHKIAITPRALQDAREKAAKLAEELISARRNAQFARNVGDHCRWCPYRRICRA